ncbi:hypothetical protein GCM10010313_01410 [Streptomyces violarus]|uniref:Putative FlgJ-related protein n=1 Tax=Streptomyces violarus TaxID=67380 RepID=A0A7W4ZJM3_9ACTN|nr:MULTISPECIES: hypothetical protein [Streptomyces]MBB3073673.1 putative FlgJ-related protein [Streptomyces violarus]WRT96434.1 hypothetical protein VJ737_01485 [Streptomyces sp. CGMCC 4.1772]GHC95865.1 hypothetical protein GCM10010313_01410 [Streptomyces violarus]
MTTTDTIAAALTLGVAAAFAAVGSWKAARNANVAAQTQTLSRIEQRAPARPSHPGLPLRDRGQ